MDESKQQAGEMPEPQETPASTETGQGGAQEFDQTRAMALIEKLRRENRELTKAAKRVQDLEAAEAQRNEAEMTELQKAQKRLADLEGELNRERKARMQEAAAKKVGLPDALANRLLGETPEELEADALAILETLPKTAKPAPGIAATNPGANGASGETSAARRSRLGF